jgi:hypothetical protein
LNGEKVVILEKKVVIWRKNCHVGEKNGLDTNADLLISHVAIQKMIALSQVKCNHIVLQLQPMV